ncbi:MAG: hypothetical protein D4S02_12330 [Rhodocyclaceae bacterium]|nr:MAG: hypothetical protein D4S02_12330 [Rhodocyclaceae bacterium]
MRLLSFWHNNNDVPLLGWRAGKRVLELATAARIAGLAAFPGRMKDLLAGHIGVMFAPAQIVLTQVQAGKLMQDAGIVIESP